MHGRISARILGGLILAGLLGLLVGDLPEVLAQKRLNKKNNKAEKAAAAKAPLKVEPPAKPFPNTPLLNDDQKLNVEQLARQIDLAISKRLSEEKVTASARSSDEEFLRRVYLDITGKVPTAEQAVRFLDSKDSRKRAQLIDELLASPEFGKHMADRWQALLLPRNSDNVRTRRWYPNLVNWLETQFNQGTPWDKIVRELLTASGEVDKVGPVIYWVANNTSDKVTDNVSRMFLGVQLQCAQCHNHPFTDWKQDEYWAMAAFFHKVTANGNAKAAAKDGGSVAVMERPTAQPARKRLPESAKILPAKYLNGPKANVPATEPLRPHFAEWATHPHNPYFARAMVNRLWAQFFGRGFVNPIDDMHDGNVASHPELLDLLSKQFAGQGFDVKMLIRAICNSETYQRSSRPNSSNAEAGPELFARMAIKPLSPEQLFDSLQLVLGRAGGPADRVRKGANGRVAPNAREQFVNFYGIEDGADPTEYQAGIPQVLRLMNAAQTNTYPVLASVMRSASTRAEVVEKLYLTVLARRPTAEEITRVNAFLDRRKSDLRQGYSDLMWAMLNSSEFVLNR
jgi:hypothetical protein